MLASHPLLLPGSARRDSAPLPTGGLQVPFYNIPDRVSQVENAAMNLGYPGGADNPPKKATTGWGLASEDLSGGECANINHARSASSPIAKQCDAPSAFIRRRWRRFK